VSRTSDCNRRGRVRAPRARTPRRPARAVTPCSRPGPLRYWTGTATSVLSPASSRFSDARAPVLLPLKVTLQ